jgi:hypothetical protein
MTLKLANLKIMTTQKNEIVFRSKISKICTEMEDYSKHPYFVKKTAEAIETLRKCPPPDENTIAQMIKEAKEKQASKVNLALDKYKDIPMFEDKMAICAEPIAKYGLPQDSNIEIIQQKITDNELQTIPIASKSTKIKRKPTKKPLKLQKFEILSFLN